MPPKRQEALATSDIAEFQASDDGAWYSVRLSLEDGGALRVMYCEFPEYADELFQPDRFGSPAELEEFGRRIRPVSAQLQDRDCRTVIEGMQVCASLSSSEKELQFFDAFVHQVIISDQCVVEGKEECSCKFVLLWQEGPLAGKKTSVGVENICLRHPKGSDIDPVLACFLNMARNKLEARKWKPGQLPLSSSNKLESTECDDKLATCTDEKLGSLVGHSKGPQFSPCNDEDIITPKGTPCGDKKLGKDIDLGSSEKWKNCATESYYFFRIENLERDITPFIVMGFILEQTSVCSQSFICPGYSSESYSTGVILVETKEKADKLFDFLFNPAHIIMSSRGRPWVMSKKWWGPVESVMPTSEKQPLKKNVEHSSKLKLVHKGSEEYEKGQLLLEIHQEFHEHAQLLRRSLARAERELMKDPL